MATLRTAQELADEIAELGRTMVRRVVRLPPQQANTYLRIIAQAKNDRTVVEAIDRYLLAVRRAEKHADPLNRQLFAEADAALSKHLATLTGPDITLLERELVQRRLL